MNDSLHMISRSIIAALLIATGPHEMGTRAMAQDASMRHQSPSGPIALSPMIAQAERTRIEAIGRATPSAVSVYVPGGGGGGSGVLISPDGYALTNFHVTSPAGSFMRCSLSDGNVYDAVIVGIDPVGDLAMVRLLGDDGPRDDFPFAALGNSRTAQSGDWCMVIGNPFLLASNLKPTVTWGILSGVNRYQYPSGTLLEYGDCLQTDASVNPGNSGGPIYDAQGQLLGIVGRCSFEKRGRVNVGVGYAISINQAMNFVGHLRSGRIVDHATLGATVATDPDGSVRVTNILETSDAYRRGIRYASEILEVDGRIVLTANELQNILATFPAGWRVKVRYRESGETRDTLVRLRSVHAPDELLAKMKGALPPPPPRPEPKRDPSEDGPGDGDSHGEGEKPGGQPHGDDGHGHGDADHQESKAKSDIPVTVQAVLQQREGYANYYMNLQQQNRFAKNLGAQFPAAQTLAAHDESAKTRLQWVIEGMTDDEAAQSVRLLIADNKIAMAVGDRTLQADRREDVYDAISAGSIGGITGALDAWRRMICDGPTRFGESYYLGTVPLGGERPLRDCMVGIDGENEIHWLCHPETGLVEAIECFADRDEDPAELWVIRDDPSPEKMPAILDLRYGTESVLRVRVTGWKVQPDVGGQSEETGEQPSEKSSDQPSEESGA